MTMKPFEIQSTSLSIAGVTIDTSAQGKLVIPGVTRASTSVAIEVEDTNDQTQSWTGSPVVIDGYTYAVYISNDANGLPGWQMATYAVEQLDDDGFIDGITVVNGGANYTGEAVTFCDVMYAAPEGTTIDNQNPSAWVQIPFKVRCGAGEIESEFGGSGGGSSYDQSLNTTDEVTFNSVTLNSYPTDNTHAATKEYVDDVVAAINTGGSGSTILPPYKGFRAHYGSMFGNDSDPNGPINKLVIYQDTVQPTSTISSNTDNDQFTVTGLAGSSTVAMLVTIGQNISATSTTELKTFVEAVIDNVLLNEGTEGQLNNADTMKDSFYNNFNNFSSTLSDLKENFQFWNTQQVYYNIVSNNAINSATGSGLTLYGVFYNTNSGQLEMSGGGNGGPGGYLQGDIIIVPGTSIQDYQGNTLSSPENDLTVTITQVDGSGIVQGYTITGTVPYTTPGWPSNNINDGGSDEYDTGNFIDTDLGSSISYNNGLVAYGDSSVGGGDYVATYQNSIFGFFVSNANINSIGTSGGSGFDGSGQSATGSLYGGDTAPTTPVIEWTNPNNNVWRIEEYNGGASVSYSGNDYDAKWFDVANHTGGNSNFRGAIIQYHAYVNNGTIIGTIHLANDYTQQNATHTEHMSGGSNLQYVTLWDCNNERGQLYFKMTNGNYSNLLIQWTAKIFYGRENNC